MKRFALLLLLGSLILANAVAADLGACPASTTLSALLGNSCFNGTPADFVFFFPTTAYSLGAGDAASVNVAFTVVEGTTEQHHVIFSRAAGTAWTSGFTLNYFAGIYGGSTVAGDPAAAPAAISLRASADQINTALVPNTVADSDMQCASFTRMVVTSTTPTGTVDCGATTNQTISTASPPGGSQTLQVAWGGQQQIAVHDTLSGITGAGDNVLNSLEQNFFESAVPEPATLLLLGSGMVLLGMLKKRRNNRT
jgi:PEP-CTERM motif-containing protein